MGEGWKEKDHGVIFTLDGDKEEKESESEVQNKGEEKTDFQNFVFYFRF